ncbi:uncharacterized protein LOC125449560 [Stegostoma tigrinum]|uniref:uncharacterized protein LOC125449560 n=1 Tax=Stegostoma tigrinum TaxID=3053191 RepID=UPI00286FB32B|nr:uncharacterized protein LOC125449560 [Stegostoma tigrinum]
MERHGVEEMESLRDGEMERRGVEEMESLRDGEMERCGVEEMESLTDGEMERRGVEEMESLRDGEMERRGVEEMESLRDGEMERRGVEEMESLRDGEMERRGMEEMDSLRDGEMEKCGVEEMEIRRDGEMEKCGVEEMERRGVEEMERQRDVEAERRRLEEMECPSDKEMEHIHGVGMTMDSESNGPGVRASKKPTQLDPVEGTEQNNSECQPDTDTAGYPGSEQQSPGQKDLKLSPRDLLLRSTQRNNNVVPAHRTESSPGTALSASVPMEEVESPVFELEQDAVTTDSGGTESVAQEPVEETRDTEESEKDTQQEPKDSQMQEEPDRPKSIDFSFLMARPPRSDKSDEEEEVAKSPRLEGANPKGAGPGRRVQLFPGMDSSFKKRIKSRNKSANDSEDPDTATAPMQRSKSLRFPVQIGHAFRKVLPGKAEKTESRSDNSSPSWLQALKPKKKK